MEEKKVIFLKDDEVKALSKENYADILKNIDQNTYWGKVYYKDVLAKGIDNVPILVDTVKKEHGISSRDDVVVSCMGNAGICLQFPVKDKITIYPVSTNGYLGVISRAGFGGPALNYEESTKRIPMSAESRAIVINSGLETFKDSESAFGYVLCRFERIDAFHSAEYSVLPVSELMTQVEDNLNFLYSDWEFTDGSVSPSFVSLKWLIKDTHLIEEINKVLKKKTEKYSLCIVMLSSDTGTSSAKLYLALQGASGFPMLIGSPKCLPHKYGHIPQDFGEQACAIAASVRENVNLIQSLTKKKCLNISGAIRLFANKFRLPKRIAMQIAEDYGTGYPNGATFYEVFIALQDIIYLYQKDKDKVTPEKYFELSEAVAGMLFIEHLSEYDRNFEWAE